jgi:hypothetical protein
VEEENGERRAMKKEEVQLGDNGLNTLYGGRNTEYGIRSER